MIEAKPTRGDVVAWWLVLFPLLSIIATIPFLLAVGFFQLQPGQDGDLEPDASVSHVLSIRDAATGREIGARDRTTRVSGDSRVTINAYIYDDRVDWDQDNYAVIEH